MGLTWKKIAYSDEIPAAALAAAVGTNIADAEPKAPSGDTVFHALAAKAPSSGIALSALATQAAQTINANATDGAASPTAIAISASQIVARLATGNIKGCSTAEIKTLLLSTDLPEDVAIVMDDSLSADGKCCALMAESGTAGEALTFGQLCYFASDSKWWKADWNDAATTYPLMGFCILTAAGEGQQLLVLCLRARLGLMLYSQH